MIDHMSSPRPRSRLCPACSKPKPCRDHPPFPGANERLRAREEEREQQGNRTGLLLALSASALTADDPPMTAADLYRTGAAIAQRR